MVLAVVALPLCGVLWFAMGQINDARSDVDSAAALDLQVESVNRLTQLEVALSAEAVWSEVASSLEILDIDESVVVVFTGLDFRAEIERSSDDVDRLVAELGLGDVRAAVDAVRALPTPNAESYRPVVGMVASTRSAAERQLVDTVADRPDGAALQAEVASLQAASQLWLSVADQMEIYFSLQFSDLSDGADPIMLVEARRDHTEALSRLTIQAQTDPGLAALLDEFVGSASHRTVSQVVETYLATTISGETPSSSALSGVLALLDVTEEAGRLHSGLLAYSVQAADAQVASESAEAARRQMEVWWLVALLAISSALLVTVVLGRINRPLKELAESAQALSDGQLRPVGSFTGPREVRIVGDAIGQTAEVLALVERQANALTADRLDDPALSSEVPGRLGESIEGALKKLASSLADRSEFERMLWDEAHHDALTGLANRRAVMQHLKELGSSTSARQGAWSVLLMDLDRFKAVNDRYGHQAGDEVLKATSERLRHAVRPEDFLGRLGGDEFIAVVKAGADTADEIARRIVEAVAAPIDLGGTEVTVGISVGIAESADGSALDVEELLTRADSASYSVKRAGGSAVGHDQAASATAE